MSDEILERAEELARRAGKAELPEGFASAAAARAIATDATVAEAVAANGRPSLLDALVRLAVPTAAVSAAVAAAVIALGDWRAPSGSPTSSNELTNFDDDDPVVAVTELETNTLSILEGDE